VQAQDQFGGPEVRIPSRQFFAAKSCLLLIKMSGPRSRRYINIIHVITETAIFGASEGRKNLCLATWR
jgi:hypothetical protein